MILTPLFTPALDTAVGIERTTTQLLDVRVENGNYSFGFDRVKKWIDLCQPAGSNILRSAISSPNGEQNTRRRSWRW